MSKLQVTVVEARGIRSADFMGKSDPYVKLHWMGEKYKTSVISQDLTPTWNEDWTIPFPDGQMKEPLEFQVYDYDALGSNDKLGFVQVKVPDNPEPFKPFEGWYKLDMQGELRLRFVYLPSATGIAAGQAPAAPYQQQQQQQQGYPPQGGYQQPPPAPAPAPQQGGGGGHGPIIINIGR